MKTILCYGDSNTWGFDPDGHNEEAGTETRFPYDVRWTGVLQKKLGADYLICEEGMNARTTVFDDPICPYRNGLAYITPCLLSKAPVDLIMIMLGTNDVKVHLHQTASTISKGLERIVTTAQDPVFGVNGKAPEILIAGPIDVGRKVGTRWTGAYYNEDAHTLMKKLRPLYENIARIHGCHYIDASLYAQPNEADYLHMDAQGHAAFAQAVAGKVKEILG